MCMICEVKRDGRNARLNRLSVAACPWPLGTAISAVWVEGWNDEDEEALDAIRSLEKMSAREKGVKR
jgi:hypothetical protein